MVTKGAQARAQIRSDVQIQQDVIDELRWDARIQATRIGVSVRDGIVTLTGTVESCLERHIAQDAAHRVAGVVAVVNEIDVKLPSFAMRTDAELAQAALYALKWDAGVPTTDLDVSVAHGWITLNGEVDWLFQKESAERVVRRLTGVRGVSNLIAVRAHVTPADIKGRIERALARNAEIDAQGITVEITGATVVLKGVVQAYYEKRAAERSAWSAPGITAVDNRIAIAPARLPEDLNGQSALTHPLH